MRYSVNRLPMKLNRTSKPCKSPDQNPGGSNASGSGWWAHPLSTSITPNASTNKTERKTAARYRQGREDIPLQSLTHSGLFLFLLARGPRAPDAALRATNVHSRNGKPFREIGAFPQETAVRVSGGLQSGGRW